MVAPSIKRLRVYLAVTGGPFALPREVVVYPSLTLVKLRSLPPSPTLGYGRGTPFCPFLAGLTHLKHGRNAYDLPVGLTQCCLRQLKLA